MPERTVDPAVEIQDVNAGKEPRRWRCDCGVEHRRGHFQTIGIHRCLACGYIGPGGTVLEK